MKEPRLGVMGVGVVTDAFEDIRAFVAGIPIGATWGKVLKPSETPDIGAIAQHDTLTQLALRAAHQAMTMSAPNPPADDLALLVQSSWGNIDATVAYLESMLEAEGKYASPRHFSRSVYSSVAAAAAIHFQIQGPCETIAFDRDPIGGALQQAWRLIETRRAKRVLTIWVEQSATIANDLARRAVTQLHRRQFERYVDAGYGAVALMLGSTSDAAALREVVCSSPPTGVAPPHRAFAMDGALDLLAQLIRA